MSSRGTLGISIQLAFTGRLALLSGFLVVFASACGSATVGEPRGLESCTPDCADKECGADGCGGICGDCNGGELCDGGLAICYDPNNCTADCGGGAMECGSDGCGGSCGVCSGTDSCEYEVCVACSPDCAGKQCGADGCGGICGDCSGGELCDGGLGICYDPISCTPDCGGGAVECGSDGCGGTCGACSGSDSCQGGVCFACIPNCAGKQCGADGCGGTCGACHSTDTCNYISGLCGANSPLVGGGSGETRPRDAQGWTIFNPSVDTRQIHVSSASGSDTGGDGSIQAPYATVAKALSEARNGFADWVLLKRGDTWNEGGFNFDNFSGRSRTEPFLLGTYGGSSDPRPVVKTGTRSAVTGGRNTTNIAIVGIEWRANLRDPADPGYTGPSATSPDGIALVVGSGQSVAGTILEDNLIAYYTYNLKVEGYHDNADVTDVVVRRNVIVDAYGNGSRSQGIFCARPAINGGTGITFEENIFDHNGWLVQSTSGGENRASGQATDENHSIYCSRIAFSTFVRNVSVRPSAYHFKTTSFLTSGYPGGYNQGNVVDNNLLVDSEIGLELVGNPKDETTSKNRDGIVRNNVLLKANQSRQTQRDLAWGLNIWYANNIHAHDNLLLNAAPTATLTRPIYFQEPFDTAPTVVENNIIFNWGAGVNSDTTYWKHGGSYPAGIIHFRNNIIESDGWMVDARQDISHMNFSGNTYTSQRAAGEWFDTTSGRMSLSEWNAYSGDTGVAGPVNFVDDTRTIETYMASIGETPTYARFIQLQRAQRRGAWRTDMEADVINDYFRAGFTPR